MNIVKQIPVYLLAIIFLVFGLNFFLHFIPMPPMDGDAGAFLGIIYKNNFLLVVKILELSLAILLIFKPTRALALLLIAPISISILLFELLIVHHLGIGILLVFLNGIAIFQLKEKYLPIIR